MPVFWVHTSARKESGGHHGFLFEVEAASVVEFTELIKSDGIVAGHKLYTTDDGRGGRLVKERIATAVTMEGLASVEDYGRRVWEPEDDQAAATVVQAGGVRT